MAKNNKISLLDLKREYKFLKKDIDRELKECLSTQNWILSKKVTQFENQVAKYLSVKQAIGVASGTDALILSLRALALSLKDREYFDEKDEIITTAFSFVATAEAIVRSGATPVFVDIDPNTFNINPDEIKKAINKNTVGILPVHLFGLTCQMDEIVKIARENNLFIVEDVAQAFGAEYPFPASRPQLAAKKLGTIGDCGAFSTFPSKNLGAYGDGGFIATNNNKVSELIKVLRNHGQTKQYNAQYIGYNSRLDTIQAAILLAKLEYVDKFNALRIRNAQKYNDAFKNIKDIQIPASDYELTSMGYKHVYNLYTIKVPGNMRAKFLNSLNDKGIQARIYYPLALYKMKAFNRAKVKGNLKNTNELTSRVLSLPCHPFLKSQEVAYICDILKKATHH